MVSRWCEVDPLDTKSIPQCPACYVIFSHGLPVYIGQTRNLRKRIYSYRFNGGLGAADLVHTPWGDLQNVHLKFSWEERYGEAAALELRLIRRMRPRFNRAGVPK